MKLSETMILVGFLGAIIAPFLYTAKFWLISGNIMVLGMYLFLGMIWFLVFLAIGALIKRIEDKEQVKK